MSALLGRLTERFPEAEWGLNLPNSSGESVESGSTGR